MIVFEYVRGAFQFVCNIMCIIHVQSVLPVILFEYVLRIVSCAFRLYLNMCARRLNCSRSPRPRSRSIATIRHHHHPFASFVQNYVQKALPVIVFFYYLYTRFRVSIYMYSMHSICSPRARSRSIAATIRHWRR